MTGQSRKKEKGIWIEDSKEKYEIIFLSENGNRIKTIKKQKSLNAELSGSVKTQKEVKKRESNR